MAYYYDGFDAQVKETGPDSIASAGGVTPPPQTPTRKRYEDIEGTLDELLGKLVYLLKLIEEKKNFLMNQVSFANNLLILYGNTQDQASFDRISFIKASIEHKLSDQAELAICRNWAEETVEDLTDLDLSNISYDEIISANRKSTIRGSFDAILRELSVYYVRVNNIQPQATYDALNYYYEKTRFADRLERVRSLQEEITELAAHAQELGHTKSFESLTSMNHNIEKAIRTYLPVGVTEKETHNMLTKLREGVVKLEAILQIYPNSLSAIRIDLGDFEARKNAATEFINKGNKHL